MDIEKIREELLLATEKSATPRDILKSDTFKNLYQKIREIAPEQRAEFGAKINSLKQEILQKIAAKESEKAAAEIDPIDVTAPQNINSAKEIFAKPEFVSSGNGTIHPISQEIAKIVDIFTNMGFHCQENIQLDDDFHMFESLNFPENHPARDGYDTFRTEENFIPPAHDTAMDNRLLSANREQLDSRGYIAEIAYGRTFRNEDADVTHDHTFYQYDGVFVSRTANLSQMLGILREFFESYYGEKLKIKTQPGYFPFTEPSLEFAIEKPASLGGGGKGGEWLEMLGCGMLHPNVLKKAGIDPEEFRGFAWGGGIERLAMLKYGIEDLRHFESGNLNFLREF